MSSSERTEQNEGGESGRDNARRTQITHAEEHGHVFLESRHPDDRESNVIRLDEPDAETLFWQLAEWLGYDEMLPEWEIGVQESNDEDEWDFYHPTAADPLSARRRALAEASEDFDSPEIYQVTFFGNDDRGLGRMELGQYPRQRYAAWHTDEYLEFMEDVEP